MLRGIVKVKNIFTSKDIPRKAIVIVDNDTGYKNFWHIGTQNGRSILQVVCNFMVTNITDHPVSLANAVLKGVNGERDSVLISVQDVQSRYSGSYPIPPKRQTAVSLCFIIHPRKIPKDKELITLKVGVIDQFGNKYWVKNIICRAG